MTKEAVFTLKLEQELRSAFMAEAVKEDRPASQIMRELMRRYIEESRQRREYDDFLQRKVDAGRISVRADQGRFNAVVEAEFAARREQARSKE